MMGSSLPTPAALQEGLRRREFEVLLETKFRSTGLHVVAVKGKDILEGPVKQQFKVELSMKTRIGKERLSRLFDLSLECCCVKFKFQVAIFWAR
jgi:hypothetical protein